MNYRNLNKYVFIMLSSMLVLLLVTSMFTSSILAKYSLSETATDNLRVAEWNISFKDGSGTMLHSIMSSTHLESGSSGEWSLDIKNESEVDAIFSEDSNVKIRLHSPDFHIDHEHNMWDFLVDQSHNHIDNPINFKAYMYNCSLDYINDPLSDLSQVREIEVFNTKEKDEDLNFKMIIDQGEIYFECIINVGERLNETDDFYLPMGDGNACLKVFWEVEALLDAVDTSSRYKSFYLVKESEYTTTLYDGKDDGEGVINIAGQNYVIAYKEYDYFDYLIYTSSLGGEIMITFKDQFGQTYVKRCTKLSSDEKTSLLARNKTSPTVESIKEYIELKEYHQYNAFLEKQSDYVKTTGYLSLGLECRIVLDLSVEQVD